MILRLCFFISFLTFLGHSQSLAQADLNNLFRGSGYSNPESNRSMNLTMPHRTEREVSDWLSMVISEALNFTSPSLEQGLKNTRGHFDESGHAQYLQFLQEENIAASVRSGRFTIHNYVEARPLLINEGTVDGRYRWLFEVPVTVTTLQRGSQDYKTLSPRNTRKTIRVQLGRVEKETIQDIGLRVERWARP